MNISDINLTEIDLKKIIESYFYKTHNQINVKYKINNISVEKIDRNGFLGDYYTLTIFLSIKKVSYEKFFFKNYISLFVKKLPSDNNYISGFNVFGKEINIYKNLLPRLVYINNNSNNNFITNHYLTKSDELIVFDNLKELNYKLFINEKSKYVFDFEHLSFALKVISRLHAASLILEFRTKQKVNEMYKNCLVENAYPTDPTNVRVIGFNNAVSVHCEFIKRIDKYKNASNLNEIITKFIKTMNQIYDYVLMSKVYQNVVNHGDLWCNNIMFKYDALDDEHTEDISDDLNGARETTKPIDAKLIDFQLARYAPPALDIMTLITVTTNSDFRKENLSKLIKIYYESLAHELSWCEYDLNEIGLTENNLNTMCNNYKLFGLIENSLFNHLILLPEFITKDLLSSEEMYNDFFTFKSKRIDICLNAFNNDENYRFRLTDVLCEIIDEYVLK